MVFVLTEIRLNSSMISFVDIFVESDKGSSKLKKITKVFFKKYLGGTQREMIRLNGKHN